MEDLNNYLEQIQEELIEEQWAIAVGALAIFGLMIWANIEEQKKIPRHPKWRKIWDDYKRMFGQCASYFPDESTVVQGGGALGDIAGDFSYESYKANPQRVKCQMTARLNTLKKFIKWVSTVGEEEVCKYNKKKEKCMQYVDQVKRIKIAELRDLTRVISNSSEKKLLNRTQFTKIHKVLGVKKGKK